MGFTDFASDAGLTRMSQIQLPAHILTDTGIVLENWVKTRSYIAGYVTILCSFTSKELHEENKLVRVYEAD
jgi:hypothetical protein